MSTVTYWVTAQTFSLALPLGELSPKVTERALPCLPPSKAPSANPTAADNGLLFVKIFAYTAMSPLSFPVNCSYFSSYTVRYIQGSLVQRELSAKLTEGLPLTQQSIPPKNPYCLTVSAIPLALPLGELSPKVTERAFPLLPLTQTLSLPVMGQGKRPFDKPNYLSVSSPRPPR